MGDIKLELLHDFSLWSEALEHIASKNADNLDILSELDILSNKVVILDIIESIEKGTYRVGVPVVRKIRKDTGGFRELYINSVRDRVVLRVINKIYYGLYGDSIHRLCVSYKEGVAVGKVVSDISKKLGEKELKGYKVDISKFFDSVSREALFSALDSLSSGSPLDMVVREYYSDDRVFSLEAGEYIERYKGLAQGCALSSFLCNYILRDIDEYFSGSVIYYRYSDDIVIFDEDDSIIDRLSDRLKSYGLSLNLNKLEKVSSKDWFTFLGFSIRGSKISISKNSLYKFQKDIMLRYRNCKSYSGFRRSVYSYLYSCDAYSCRGWFGGKVGVVNCLSDIKCIDMWVRDILLAFRYRRDRIGSLGYSPYGDGVIVRGKGRNVRKNREKGAGEDIISMLSLYHLYRLNKNLYLNELVIRGII